MSFLIFLIGTTVFLSYIFFFSYFEKEEEETIKIDDAMDYDGHGNMWLPLRHVSGSHR